MADIRWLAGFRGTLAILLPVNYGRVLALLERHYSSAVDRHHCPFSATFDAIISDHARNALSRIQVATPATSDRERTFGAKGSE